MRGPPHVLSRVSAPPKPVPHSSATHRSDGPSLVVDLCACIEVRGSSPLADPLCPTGAFSHAWAAMGRCMTTSNMSGCRGDR